MEQGILSSDAFSSVIRSIASKRRQGVLDIDFETGPVKLFFVQGRIVEIQRPFATPQQETIERLKAAGYLPGSFNPPDGSYQEIFTAIREQPGYLKIDAGLFKRVIHHRVLDSIYSLEFSSGAPFRFSVRIVDYDREFCPAISGGQVLLDLVSLQTEGEKFGAVFRSGTLVKVVAAPRTSLSEEEAVLCDLMGEHGMVLEQLKMRSMLSIYHFQEGLTGLLDRGLISIVSPSVQQPGAEDLFGEDVLSALDSSIDRTFAAEAGSPAEEAAVEGPAEVVPAEGRVVSIESDFKLRLRMASGMMLQKTWVPGLAAGIFTLLSLLLPLLFWGEAYRSFSH